MRKITPEEYGRVVAGLYQLTDILIAVGIMELQISAKKEEIFWDTQGKGQVDPARLDQFFTLIENHYQELMEAAARTPLKPEPNVETIADRARRFNRLLGPGPGREPSE